MRVHQWKSWAVNAGLALASTLLCLLLLEGAVRWGIQRFHPQLGLRIQLHQKTVERGRSGHAYFASHPYLSYQPSEIVLTATGCVINHEPFTLEKPPGALRVACLGASTTKFTYPLFLRDYLRPCFGNRTIEVMDWSCAGWTIVESTLNYILRVRMFHPDIIILHHGYNDMAPRLRKDFQFDYAHFRKTFDFPGFSRWDAWLSRSWLATWLQMRRGRLLSDLDEATVRPPGPDNIYSVPPPGHTLLTYRSCVSTLGALARADGARLILAGMIYNVTGYLPREYVPLIEEHNAVFRAAARELDALYVDVQPHFAHHPGLFVDSCHLKTPGNQLKSALLASAVARVMDVTPLVWVTGGLNSTEDLTGKPDAGVSPDRALVIRWQPMAEAVRQVHVWVRIDGGKEAYLGQTASADQTYFEWKSGSPLTHPAFRDGPLPGHSYEFLVYGIVNAPPVPWVTLAPVQWIDKHTPAGK
ncbi:MAG: SGNH/GDSL hydrolase family protein [Candidatus Omnitrophica bacterium]|nr:SGNH/GDSL hydrolase family protein [Candidatus Omnitrophota bacterium]